MPRRFGQALLSLFLVASVLQIATSCNKRKGPSDPQVEMGRSLYFAHCIACHNANPALNGSLGPAVKGSGLDLLQARVLRGEYPPGYTPKRPTHIMVRLPLTEENVQAIHAFLNAP